VKAHAHAKAAPQAERGSRARADAGAGAAAIAPPAYGIAFLDSRGAVVQRVVSQVADFDHTWQGTIVQIKQQCSQLAEFQQLMLEQFPGLGHERFYALTGLNGLLHEQSLVEGDYTGTTLRLDKQGSRLNIFITHAHNSPLDSNLYFGAGKPHMDLHRWFATPEAAKGMGFRVFDSMKSAGEALGLSHFEADAIGDPITNAAEVGYYVWGRFGFDPGEGGVNAFRQRLQILNELDQGYAAVVRGELDDAEAQMDADAPARQTDNPATLGLRKTALHNKPLVTGIPRTDSEQIEDGYIDKKLLYLKWTGLLSKHRGAVRWLAPQIDNLVGLNDIFIAAENAGKTERVAALWKDIGNALMRAQFVLDDPAHSSQRVFNQYKARKLADLRNAGTSLAMLYGWSDQELERRVRSGELEQDIGRPSAREFDFYQ
jgi:hypothetical protein